MGDGTLSVVRWPEDYLTPKAQSLTLQAGCLDCEHSVADTTYGVPIAPEQYVKQFEGQYRLYNNFTNYPILCLYNEGNFFNKNELPERARRDILKIIAANRNIKRLVLESLPLYITEDVLVETTEILKGISWRSALAWKAPTL